MALEKLLNIKETAEYLNVSEMTVRRWTNDGILSCYRIGGRRARRFRFQDLKGYLERNPTLVDSPDVSLGVYDLSVPDGSHVTHLSLGDPESANVGVSYVAKGLIRNETVLMVCPEDISEQMLQMLQVQHVDVQTMQQAGRLCVSRGMDTPASHARYISELAAQSVGRIRIFGDMTWTKEKGWVAKDLRELEEIVNLSPVKARGILFLCQYALNRFSGEEAMLAIETHSHCLYRGELRENMFLQ
ncbi:MAG: MEDS domain-containing protein [Desulfatirhabdiaceae bacterium]